VARRRLLRAATALGGPTWFLAVGGGFAVAAAFAVVVAAFGLAGLLGGVGGHVGGWVAARTRRRPPAGG
jgi:hypothetical protein